MNKVRKRYLLIKYDRKLLDSDSLKQLLMELSKDDAGRHSSFKHIMFTLGEGLAVFSVPHTSVQTIKAKVSSSGRELEVVLCSGTLGALRRRIKEKGLQKGL